MSAREPHYMLQSANSSLVADCSNRVASILYWGARLDDSITPEMLATPATPKPARPDVEAPLSLSPEHGAGFPGTPGIQVHRDGRQWGVFAALESVTRDGAHVLTFESACDATGIRITHRLSLDPDSSVLEASTAIVNVGDSDLAVAACFAPCIPVAPHYTKITAFEGGWSDEFRMRTLDRFAGTYLRENRAGRTSLDCFPGVVLHTPDTKENSGAACGLHLGWSGNHSLRVETLSDGRAFALMGELLLSGELTLAPGERYASPTLYGAVSGDGFSGVSRAFHRHVRKRFVADREQDSARPVHFNTWEAVYFDVDLDRLCRLADAAADVGAERFVLDDGWFRGRRSDAAGLGDWFVDETVFPDGLGPLIEHVHGLGMSFGLWLEPEMVNPDSDLYRAHPDWVLSAAPAPLVTARNQLVLDLTRPAVSDYLFERIDALLSEYPIRYLKWDMNRDVSQPGGHDGRIAVHAQTLGVYELMARVRAAHPEVEFESCSSGGGRADFGVLTYANRIWTSDNDDPLDRLRIQKGFSMFLPAELMGAHVGPYKSHITGRTSSIETRAAVALFGHMGIEADLLAFDDDELDKLKTAVALHKKHRGLIHGGDLYRLDTDVGVTAFSIVSADRREALVSFALLESAANGAASPLRLAGLTTDKSYSVEQIWPSREDASVDAGTRVSGAALLQEGLPVPNVPSGTVLVYYLIQVA